MKKFTIRLVVVIHALFFAAILACLPLAFAYPHLHQAILWFIGAVLLSQIPYRTCVLTHIEQQLRGSRAYHGTCLSHYLERFFHVDISDRIVNIFTTIYFVTVILIAIFYKLHQAF